MTYAEAFEVQPFGNLPVTMDLTREQIELLNRIGGGDDLAALVAYLGARAPAAPPADRIAGI